MRQQPHVQEHKYCFPWHACGHVGPWLLTISNPHSSASRNNCYGSNAQTAVVCCIRWWQTAVCGQRAAAVPPPARAMLWPPHFRAVTIIITVLHHHPTQRGGVTAHRRAGQHRPGKRKRSTMGRVFVATAAVARGAGAGAAGGCSRCTAQVQPPSTSGGGGGLSHLAPSARGRAAATQHTHTCIPLGMLLQLGTGAETAAPTRSSNRRQESNAH